MSERRGPLGLLVGFLGVALLSFLVVPPDRSRPDRVLVAAAAAYLLWRARRPFGTGGRPVAGWEPPVGEPPPPHAHMVQVARVQAVLSTSCDSAEQFERSALPLLRRLVEQQLALRHGISLADDPGRARQLMDEELWRTVASPTGARRPAPQDLARLVAAIERI